MKVKRRIINMLRNPDEKTLERLSSEYPQAEQSHKDKMYEKVKERMSSRDNVFTDEVRGVEKYTRRHLWKMVSAAMMSIALVGGAIGGGAIMLKSNRNTMPSAEIAEETSTEITEETTTMSKEEFKQYALNDCVKLVCDENEQKSSIEAVNESDLDFLD
ncbi:hypothetical protein [Ruminococcus sp.]|uniref:hypothetical protein n=1 Tax=Ruminococcus sp. TaxID=41978 RepID=UPI0025EAF805|nr:hypothetical protein [Ruminococcus sp.]MBR1432499.1 hypothetical protein [Ruminococcus sp.]